MHTKIFNKTHVKPFLWNHQELAYSSRLQLWERVTWKQAKYAIQYLMK